MTKKNFTILELLLVISIAGVMLTVALPAFSRLLKGSASGIAMRELSARLGSARSKAIAGKEGFRVAIVFPSTVDKKSSSSPENISDSFKKKYYNQAYRACYVDPSTLTFQRWIEKDNWKFLPEGIVLDEAAFRVAKPSEKEGSTKYIIHKNATSDPDTNKPLICKVGGRSFSTEAALLEIEKYILFNRDGSIDSFPNTTLIRLRQGSSDGTNVTITKGYEGQYYPIVIRPMGKVVVYDELVKD